MAESPSEDLWSVVTQDLIQHATQRQWGLYRNDLYGLADVARRTGNHEVALELFLDVCYIDTNGPNNVGLWMDGSPVPGEEDWQVNIGFLAPVPLGYVRSLSLKLGKPYERSLDEYAPRAAKLQNELKFPLAWESSRTIIERALRDDSPDTS